MPPDDDSDPRDAGWPDPADLLRGLAAATDMAVASDWAGELIVAIDHAVGRQAAMILGDERFARLETAWRGVALLAGAAPDADVRLVDATVADRADAGWLDRLLFAGPLDTRGGRPISLLVAPEPIDAAVAGRALCPVLTDGPPTDLRPSSAAWFADAPGAALTVTTGHAVAAAAIASVAAFGWPIDVPASDDLARRLMAGRFAQAVAVWCRDHPPADPAPAAVEAAIADRLRGRFVGPRLPLRSADVSAAATPGGLAVTLRLAPRLGGDDAADHVLAVTLALHRTA